uniref:Uncharacterized protein n=1 Tax=Avena sativa TaxID=4498 RepID=A0ACD5ZW93_AVESA
MQEQLLHAAEPGRRPAQQFAGVDLRRPKGYAAAPSSPPADPAAKAIEGEPCPRCESRDTKFCYYNNYNTSQPRHFCKGCRRYWTKGGTLRSVPVGGGTRKRPSSASSGAAVKRQKPSKKRRAAPAESATTSVDDVAVVTDPDAAKMTETTTTTPPTETASEITTELVVPAAVAAEEDSFTDLLQQGDDAVSLDLGFSDYPAGGKALGDSYTFEWPPAFDLGACWSGATGFGADPDPGVFMNLP